MSIDRIRTNETTVSYQNRRHFIGGSDARIIITDGVTGGGVRLQMVAMRTAHRAT